MQRSKLRLITVVLALAFATSTAFSDRQSSAVQDDIPPITLKKKTTGIDGPSPMTGPRQPSFG